MDDGFKRPDAVVANEKEAEDVERAIGEQNEKNEQNEVTRVDTSATEPALPFSKARSIALVATVGAAPFLSVSCV